MACFHVSFIWPSCLKESIQIGHIGVDNSFLELKGQLKGSYIKMSQAQRKERRQNTNCKVHKKKQKTSSGTALPLEAPGPAVFGENRHTAAHRGEGLRHRRDPRRLRAPRSRAASWAPERRERETQGFETVCTKGSLTPRWHQRWGRKREMIFQVPSHAMLVEGRVSP